MHKVLYISLLLFLGILNIFHGTTIHKTLVYLASIHNTLIHDTYIDE